ncbi:MAG: hypothetical protein ACTHN0_00870 [Aquihabitans sp.]
MEGEVVEVEHRIPFVVEPSTTEPVHTVSELLPAGHDTYLRLFHPFVPWSAEAIDGPVRQRLRWRDLADQAGVQLAPNTTWRQLLPVLPEAADGRPWAVWDGDLEEQTADDLFSVLDDPESGPCYFEFGLVATIATDDHQRRLYRTASVAGRHDAVRHIRMHGATYITTASLSWCETQRWIVCCDNDLTSTYIATDRGTAGRLSRHPGLEVLEVTRGTRVDDSAHEQAP